MGIEDDKNKVAKTMHAWSSMMEVLVEKLCAMDNKLDKLLEEKEKSKVELCPKKAESLNEVPQDYKLRPVTESKTT